jgi:hypothetical protein
MNTITVTAYGETFTQTTKRDVSAAVAIRNYHGETVVVLSRDMATAAKQLKRDLSSGYAVAGQVLAITDGVATDEGR